MDSRKRENLAGQNDGWCVEAIGGDGWGFAGLEAGCGAVISSVQMRTCLCLRDAALSQAKDSICVVKGIMGSLFPASACWEAGICTWLSCVLPIFQMIKR
ncbi:hypothetical protein KUCAC02_008348 [Chaenocephalus aceratus]|uniref:Uncharacterized protein n=1 Tax=Chaenocephalus aceratus TaxID=36190 RepID=A0ACB9X9Z2_CHAAC|nr:hypothetical protein KUCAC02_008348 [Chaenocephalus aceratus]